jgi:hypothetical protein
MRLYPRAVVSWRTYRRGRIDNQLPIVPIAANALPDDVAERLEAVAAPLRSEGFVHAGDYGPRDHTAQTVCHAQAFSHSAEPIRAWTMDLASATIIQTVLELATRLPDGTIIGTLNPTTASIFDPPPWLDKKLMPGASVEELLAAHRARIADLSVTPLPPWDEDPLTTAQSENEAVLAHQAERGVLAKQAGGYGYTGRGAVRSVHRVGKAMAKE